MSQSEQFHEAWAHIRDNARPVIEDDIYFLDEARADMPPDAAHLARLKHLRPDVTPARPHGTTCLARRRQVNQADALGHEIAKLLGIRELIKR